LQDDFVTIPGDGDSRAMGHFGVTQEPSCPIQGEYFMRNAISRAVSYAATFGMILAIGTVHPVSAASRTVKGETKVCMKSGKTGTRLTCKMISANVFLSSTGLLAEKVDTNGPGCWVQVGMGPHGYEWRSPCPL
jgi:hypothetical protein